MIARFGLAAALAFVTVPVAVHGGQPDAAARVGDYDDAVLGIMKQRLGIAARADRFEGIVRRFYDMPAIATIILGPRWASSSPADRSAVIAALTRHSAVQLAQNFVKFGGERLVVDPMVVSRDTGRIVKVTIVSSVSSDILLYRLRQSGGEWRIVDVISEGVSQLAVERADVAATVAARGAQGLADKLAKLDVAAIRQH